MNGPMTVVANLLLLVGVCAVALLATRLSGRVRRAGSRLRENWLQRRRGPQPDVPPLERTGADLRRIRRLLDHPKSLSAVRYDGLRLAYDRLLVDACRTLDVPQELDRATGWGREVERLRVELELERGGLVVDPGPAGPRHRREPR